MWRIPDGRQLRNSDSPNSLFMAASATASRAVFAANTRTAIIGSLSQAGHGAGDELLLDLSIAAAATIRLEMPP